MINLNESNADETILNAKEIEEKLKKYDETKIYDLNKLNEELKQIIETNKLINELLEQKSQKAIINSNIVIDNKNLFNLAATTKNDPKLRYNTKKEILEDLQNLMQTKKYKNKNEILSLKKQNAELINKIKKNKQSTYIYYVDTADKENKLQKKALNIEYLIASQKIKNNIELKEINQLYKLIIRANELKKEKELYMSLKFRSTYEYHPNSIQEMSNNKTGNEDYNQYIKKIIENHMYNILSIDEENYTFFNQLFKTDKIKNLENILKYTIKFIEQMYEINKEFIQEIYQNKTDPTGHKIDTSTKKRYIASLLNFSTGNKSYAQNISHIIADQIKKNNYKEYTPILKYLCEKGLDLNKEKARKNGINIQYTKNDPQKLKIIPNIK